MENEVEKQNNSSGDDASASWKAAIGLGLVNIVLSIICGSFRIRILSTGLVIFLLLGIYGSFSSIKAGFKEKDFVAIILGIIAMVMNVAATGYYIWSIIYTIGSKLR